MARVPAGSGIRGRTTPIWRLKSAPRLHWARSYRTRYELAPFLACGCARWLQPDIGRWGITEAAGLARDVGAGARIVPHISIAMGPQIAAALQFAASSRDIDLAEYNPLVFSVANRYLNRPPRGRRRRVPRARRSGSGSRTRRVCSSGGRRQSECHPAFVIRAGERRVSRGAACFTRRLGPASFQAPVSGTATKRKNLGRLKRPCSARRAHPVNHVTVRSAPRRHGCSRWPVGGRSEAEAEPVDAVFSVFYSRS